ncbi:hypothetical protein TRVL_00731 [Trypanosoma vivax]|nr:hypothetical protein TRVL_00731 [Trypanosoma vivax]
MSTNSTIFLYITGGRTLWVPSHTPAPGENQPVHILNFASPRELSRSFYLFEMPIQIVEDTRAAAMVPGGKTVKDIVTAVNEFRRVCAEDQEFLLKRCYDPARPPASGTHGAQQQQQQQPLQQPLTGTAGSAGQVRGQTSPATDANNSNINQVILLQLLQQQQQRVAMASQMAPLQQPPQMKFNCGPPLGPAAPLGMGGNMMMGNHSVMPPPPPMGYGGNYFNPMLPPPGSGSGLMPPPAPYRRGAYGGPHAAMLGRGRSGKPLRGAMGNVQFMAPMREQPEPLPPTPSIPRDILDMYMNPTQKLICATLPGPRCTVWLRNHPIPTDTRRQRCVFCKGGIVLMLKMQATDVVNSKPVELFDQQVCAHFLIHGYCSRNNCLHRHHNEQQLRELIAGKHIELKAMTKKERDHLSAQLVLKEKEGLARAAENRERRVKDRPDDTNKHESDAAEGEEREKTSANSAVSSETQGNDDTCSLDGVNPVSEGTVPEGQEGEPGTEEATGTKASSLCDTADRKLMGRRGKQSQSRKVLNPADIGVTDTDSGDEEDPNDFFSNSSVSSASSAPSETGKDDAGTDGGTTTCAVEVDQGDGSAAPTSEEQTRCKVIYTEAEVSETVPNEESAQPETSAEQPSEAVGENGVVDAKTADSCEEPASFVIKEVENEQPSGDGCVGAENDSAEVVEAEQSMPEQEALDEHKVSETNKEADGATDSTNKEAEADGVAEGAVQSVAGKKARGRQAAAKRARSPAAKKTAPRPKKSKN